MDVKYVLTPPPAMKGAKEELPTHSIYDLKTFSTDNTEMNTLLLSWGK